MSRWQRTEPAHLRGWGSLCPLRIPQEPLDLRENTALPERGLRQADNPNQSLTLLSFQATQLLNSDPSAWARRSVLQEDQIMAVVNWIQIWFSPCHKVLLWVGARLLISHKKQQQGNATNKKTTRNKIKRKKKWQTDPLTRKGSWCRIKTISADLLPTTDDLAWKRITREQSGNFRSKSTKTWNGFNFL